MERDGQAEVGNRERGEKPQIQGKVGGGPVDLSFSLPTYFDAQMVAYLTVSQPSEVFSQQRGRWYEGPQLKG